MNRLVYKTLQNDSWVSTENFVKEEIKNRLKIVSDIDV